MKEVTEKINQAIEENLPNQVGKLLKEKLEKSEKDAEDLEKLSTAYADLLKEKQELDETLNSHAALNARKTELDEREKSIEKREREQEVFEANLRANEAEKRASEIAGFTGMVFKSPVYRKSVSDTYSIPQSYFSGVESRQKDLPPGRDTLEEVTEE